MTQQQPNNKWFFSTNPSPCFSAGQSNVLLIKHDGSVEFPRGPVAAARSQLNRPAIRLAVRYARLLRDNANNHR